MTILYNLTYSYIDLNMKYCTHACYARERAGQSRHSSQSQKVVFARPRLLCAVPITPSNTAMPVDIFPAKEHIRRLVHHLARLAGAADEAGTEHIVVLQGEHTLSRHDTDRELPFREFVFPGGLQYH